MWTEGDLPQAAHHGREPDHRVYPYLLRGLTIEGPNHAWCADITYIPVRGGFLYLVAIMDWASRRVLAWRLSNTMDTEFCLEALTDALEHFGGADIFNTDQGGQFTKHRVHVRAAGRRHAVLDGRSRSEAVTVLNDALAAATDGCPCGVNSCRALTW